MSNEKTENRTQENAAAVITENVENKLTEQSRHYLNYCEKSKRLSEASMKAYHIDLDQFLGFMKDQYPQAAEAADVDRVILQRFISYMNQNYQIRTAKRKIACLKGFFSLLEEEGEIPHSPFDKLKIRMREPITLPTVMSLAEVKRILTCVYNDDHAVSEILHLRDIAVLEFFFATGVRVHELCNLKYSDLNDRQSSIRIMGKGNKERYIYLTNKEVLEALNRYSRSLKQHEIKSEYIFLNKWGEKLSTQAARNIVTKYTKMARIYRNITPHAFRHTFATLLLEEGVDIKFIQEFLGHSSIATTQIYLHISASSARNIMNKKHPRKKLSFSSAT